MWIRSLYYLKKSFDTLGYTDTKISRFQEKQLREILDSCRELPFYQKHWPRDLIINNIEDLSKLPLVDAKVLQKQEGQMSQVLENGDSFTRHTSGTTRSPAKVRFTEQAHDWLSAVYARTLYLDNYQLRNTIVQCWDDMQDQRSWIGKQLIPKRYVDPNASLETQIEQFEKYNPKVLKYFPQTLVAICKYLRHNNKLDTVNPEIVLTYGEPLTPSTRHYIENTFNAPVRDQYAATEFGTIAWECQDGGYHIAEDAVYAEILDEEGREVSPGETGRMVLTGLVNTATPLVRYRIGDIVEAAKQSCSCNTTFKRIKSIRGREKDIFQNAEEDPVFPDQVIDSIVSEEDILSFQLVAKDDMYQLRYVPSENFNETDIKQAADKLRSKISLKPLKIEKVDSIPRSRGGKLSVIENKQTTSLDPAKYFNNI